MRIGLDIDETMCNTKSKIDDYKEKFCKEKNILYKDLINSDELILELYTTYIKNVFKEVEAKDNVSKVLNNLKKQGHTLIGITARNNLYIKEGNVEDITKTWLNKNDIFLDHIEFDCYGSGKADACKRLNIDLMLDDDLNNYYEIKKSGVNCLVYAEDKVFELYPFVNSWANFEKVITTGNKFYEGKAK